MSAVEEDLPAEVGGRLAPYPQMDLPPLEAGQPQLSPGCSSPECQSYGDSLLHRQKGWLQLLLAFLFVGELGACEGSVQQDCQRELPLHWRLLCECLQLADQTG